MVHKAQYILYTQYTQYTQYVSLAAGQPDQ
jgi:hypothetical protein